MKAGRVILGGLGLFVIVAIAGAAYLALYLDRHKGLVELGVSTALGREVRIEGGVKLRLSMTPSVSLEGLWVGNPDWAAGSYLARAGDAAISFDLVPLFSRRLEIRQVTLLNADLMLETAADGRHNWTFASEDVEDTGGVEFSLEDLKVEDSSLHYLASTGREFVVSIPNLGFDKARAGRVDFEGRVGYEGVPLSLSGSAAHKDGGGSDDRTFTVKAAIPDANLEVTGEVGGIRNFSRLQVELQSERLDLHRWLAPVLPVTALEGWLKKITAHFDSTGDSLDSLIRNARGELNAASAGLTLPGGGDAKAGSVVLNGLSIRVAPDKPVRLQTKLAYEDHSYQVDIGGGAFAELFTGGKSWDRLKLSAKGQSAGRQVEIAGELGPWSASKAGGLGLNLTLRHEGLRVGLNGTLANFEGLGGSRFALQASAPSLARLSPWVGVAVPESPPFKFSSSVEGDKQHLRLTGLKLTAGGSDIGGKLIVPLTKGGRIEAVLKSRLLDLKPYLPQSGQVSGGGVPILDRELPPSALWGLEGSLLYRVEHLKTDDLDLKAVSLDAALNKGRLKFSLLAEGERLTLDTDLKPAGERWQVELKHKGKLDLGSLIDRDRLVSDRSKSPMDIELTLRASGNSLGAILNSADGNFLMVLGKGELSEKFSHNLPLGDVLFTLLNVINTGGKAEKQAKLECAVIQLDIAKGVATSTKGLALRTDRFNVLGGGALKLRTGEIDLQFKTANRRGLGISLLGIADRLVRLTGTLDDPKVGVDVGGAVAYGAAAWATGGLTVLYDSVFKRLTAFSNPCDAVLKAAGKLH
ncbi:MAG: AsmA family protein [Sedimenticolaceae bacterium]